MAHATDVIGFKADADVYCSECTLGRYGARKLDNEGNEIHPIFRSESAADAPQHCGHCGTFLENDLTADGVKYVTEKLVEGYVATMGGYPRLPSASRDTLDAWAEFYEIDARAEIVKGLTVKVDNLDDRDGCVLVTLTGPNVSALKGESIAGSTIECVGDDTFAYAMPVDGPDLKGEIETNSDLDGAEFDFSEYAYDPPEKGETDGEE